jgi:hypothetical protein
MQPFEKSNPWVSIPTREEAQKALDIVIECLEIHTGGLNESDSAVMQRFEDI